MTAPSSQLPEQLARVHMVGIGGAGMSGLARILLARGGSVSGSDAKDSRGILALRTRGAQVTVGHDPSALDVLDGGPTVVVTTHAAIPKDNPELVEARKRGIPILYRPQVLALLMQGHRTLLISGTHGKTSTTSMSVVALQHCGSDPSFAVGGELNESGTNAHHGSGGVFVAEADESDGSLLEYTPDIVVVTNIEVDHLDFFGTEQAYVDVFDRFVALIRPGGVLVLCLDDPGSAALGGRTAAALVDRGVAVLGYGAGDHADLAPGVPLVAELLEVTPRGAGSTTAVRLSPPVASTVLERSLDVTLPGRHMALNALGALVACVSTGQSVDAVADGIESFGGVHRRFEFRGREREVDVYDDYAHHPTEVRAVLSAARDVVRHGSGRVIAVFQPHLYSRTAEFAAQFADALSLADEVLVADVYGAREAPQPGVSGLLIADAVTVPAEFVPNMSEIPGAVAARARRGDLVLTIGAGDITMQAAPILSALAQQG
ncbi:UDP-N-acetylmuramate--L-alanine ligase [Gordonia sp. PDNC005]|uniref:UDP-N-acetylmuramate--L-alanine ligase n=1 Tax=unclassified Gordonia (in: high G+C Gram-positive bacteria) TaxID=2657482 RepID=UPI0019634F44|nr:UDP-N-acetylmuramate--L-alanine ligase [Gordonia sp. PDNC005]QRY60845.1 UDP-N-acetylmuramate--L-alanine ligase [Gordonia sp. PDNC005]